MLVEVEARTLQGSSLTMALEDVDDGLIVQEIKGLDPVRATIVSSSSAKLKGSQYQASKQEDRNIVITLGLDPINGIDTVADLRNRLYEYFMPGMPVLLLLRQESGLEVEVSGVVETCEAPLFTQEPQMDISIMCFPSDFVNTTPVVLNGNTVSNTTTMSINYSGTIETGVLFKLNVNRSINEFTIYNTPADGVVRSMDFAAPMISGDELTINTVEGEKSAMLKRSGSSTSRMYAIPTLSNWLELQRGVNTLRVYATGSPIPYTITYYTRYGGL